MESAVQYVDRYLYPISEGKENLSNYGFLIGEPKYIEGEFQYSLLCYSIFKDIKSNSFNFILGNGGLGKSTYIEQVETYLISSNIPYKRVNLRELSDEQTLFDKIKQFCIKHKEAEESFLLLDSIDEAIDLGIKNISSKIKDAINLALEINKNIKTIITCRDNRFPKEILPYLKSVYHLTNDKNDYTYHLCVLTEDDVKILSYQYSCNNTTLFLDKIKEFNLGSFASSPITLKPLVKMFNEGKINEKTSHYEILEELMHQMCCELSEYRATKAENNEDNFRIDPADELLFIASKIAVELKINEKIYISTRDNITNGFYVQKLYNQKLTLNNGKTITFSAELVDATLKTKIFTKDVSGYSFIQKTYQDFLVARYFEMMHASIKSYNKIFKVNNKLHPNFIDSISFLALKNDKILDLALKDLPEEFLLSNIQFNVLSLNRKKQIFKKYIQLAKDNKISFWKYNYSRISFHKKLKYPGIEKELKYYIKSANENIKEVILEFIEDTQMPNFDKDVEKIIFAKKTTLFLKTHAIYAAKSCEYEDVLQKVANNMDNLKTEMDRNSDDQLRGVILNALYPKYIDDEKMLSCIKKPSKENFYGQYQHFIKYGFSKNINKNNALLFLTWMKNNPMKDIVLSRYGDGYSEEAQEIFKVISNYLDKNIIDEVISFQLQTKHIYQFFSKDILQKIIDNEHLRSYFIKQLIIESVNKEIYDSLIYINSNDVIKIKDIPKLMLKYRKESNEYRKELIQNFVGSMFREYLSNGIYSDVDLIYRILEKYSELKEVFGYFINSIKIDPVSILPVDEFHINEKKHYYKSLEIKQQVDERKQKTDYQNDIQARIFELIVEYDKNNNINVFYPVWQYLYLKEDSSKYYLDLQLNIKNEHSRWADISSDLQEKIIELSLKFLIEFEDKNILNVSEYIIKNQTNSSWNALAFLPIIKEKILQADYQKLIKKWNEVIIYFPSYKEEDLPIRQSLISDLYNLNTEMVFAAMFKIIEKTEKSLHHNFLKGFDLIWDDDFSNKLYDFAITNKNISFDCLTEIIDKTIDHNYEAAKLFLKDAINVFVESLSENNLSALIKLLNILIYNYADGWSTVKETIYKNQFNKSIINSIIIRRNYHGHSTNSLFKVLSDEELIELYNWLVDNFKCVNEPDPTGPHPVDEVKDFANGIISYFIESGNIDAYNKTKQAYIKNRVNKKDYEFYFKRGLQRAQYNKLQLTPINKNVLEELENKYYKEKKFIIGIDRSINIGNIIKSKIEHIGHKVEKE